MKQRTRKVRGWLLIAVLVLAASLLAGCGSATSASDGATEFDQGLNSEEIQTASPSASAGREQAPAESGEATRTDGVKLIHTAELDMETTEFDTSAEKLSKLVADCGGYFEDSSVSSGDSGWRHGRYEVRVPAEKFDSFCTQAGTLCSVTYQNLSAQDVSEDYYDTQGRLKTQQTKLARLQALMEKAETMEEIVALEDAISQTEEQIEGLSGTLKSYDSLVNYSTVSITLDEVGQLSTVREPAVGFGSQLIAALGTGGHAFVRFLQGLVLVFAYAWVWILMIAVIVVLVLWLNRRRRKKAKPAEKSPVKPEDPRQ